MQIGETQFACVMGSDVLRDGMYLELIAADDPVETSLAEVFYSDADHSMTFTCHEADLPLAVVEWLIGEARKRLPPTERD